MRLDPPHAECSELAERHAEAERRFDRSRAVDVRIRMREHHAKKHR
ncbi:hypothetical protein ACPC54_23320 [Kitasatospora sp. NPDC094028]